jgi:flagellar hook-basal body complex protein FliE
MSIEPIGSVSSVNRLGSIGGIGSVGGIDAIDTGAGSGTAASSGGDFASQLSSSLQNLQSMDNNVDNLAVQAATGQLTDVHDYIIAATQANLATQLAVQVRNKGLDAFNEVMRMQA